MITLGLHRGIGKENSSEAIKRAIDSKKVSFVEFDVLLKNHSLKTGHYYNRPIDEFDKVIDLFVRKKVFPKIDIKINGMNYIEIINKVLENISKKELDFVLVNISGYPKFKSLYYVAERYLVEAIYNYKLEKRVKLNIDLGRYKKYYIRPHLSKIARHVYSISPEINSNIDLVIELCKLYHIKRVMFWFDEKLKDEKLKEKIIKNAQKIINANLELMFDAGLDEYNLINEILRNENMNENT